MKAPPPEKHLALTVDTLADDAICEIEAEAAREGDLEALRICQLAYRHGGRGNGHPLARSRVVRWLNQRSAWSATG